MTDERLFIFLRAVNLGRVNKVPMKQLKAAIEEADLGECGYLLQSGNLIFRDPTIDVSELKRAVERLIEERFEVKTAAVARTPEEVGRLLEANPFETPDGGSVQIAMWDDQPDRAGLEELASADHGEDRLQLVDGAAIILYAGGSHRSRLSNGLIERKLKVASTQRNIRTLVRLLEDAGR